MNKITKVTRKWILLDLIWYNIEKIIISFFKDENLPSYDWRFKWLELDYYQHRINNPEDWEDDWYIEDDRLDFFWMSDEKFLDFLSFLIHPEQIIELWDKYLNWLFELFNNKLIQDWFEIKKSSKKIDWYFTYIWKEILWWNKKVNFYVKTNWYYHSYELYWDDNKVKEEYIFKTFEWNINYPCLILYYNDWNDYGHRTAFDSFFYINKNKSINLWRIKILDKNNNRITIIPSTFSKLPDNFCSIFNGEEWLNKLDSELIDYKQSILLWLREVWYYENINILSEFKSIEWFSYSLLRESFPHFRIKNLEKVIANFWIKNQFWNIFFDFENKNLPNRINILIWKNWCWKTTLLSNICKEIIEYAKIKRNDKKILNRPSFSQVIQISYSIFDDFYKPKTLANTNNIQESKYIYCWIRDEENEVSILNLQKKLSESLKIISKKEKTSIYSYLLNDLLESDKIDFNKIEGEFIKYSSGQKILIVILAQIISNIDENSLLLFDEPETHLHPNMIFKLIKVLYQLLDDNNSYLIIATHSPIILQQIPAKYVNVLEEWWNRKLNNTHECFWENFSEITKEIFWNYESKEILYKEIFKDLSKNKTEEEILEFFDWKLSINARIYLKAIFNNKK